MRAHTMRKLRMADMAPHTIDDSVRIAQQGVNNLLRMKEAFPSAYLEEIHGIGRVWVADVRPEQLEDFEFAVDQDGQQTVVPFAVVSTINVYLPTSTLGSRMRLSEIKSRAPEVHRAILGLLRPR